MGIHSVWWLVILCLILCCGGAHHRRRTDSRNSDDWDKDDSEEDDDCGDSVKEHGHDRDPHGPHHNRGPHGLPHRRAAHGGPHGRAPKGPQHRRAPHGPQQGRVRPRTNYGVQHREETACGPQQPEILNVSSGTIERSKNHDPPCSWRVEAPKYHIIQIEVEEFEVDEGSSNQCSASTVCLYDNRDAQTDSVMGPCCGCWPGDERRLATGSNYFFLEYTRDNRFHDKDEDEFEVHYEFYNVMAEACDSENGFAKLTGTQGQVTSPGFDDDGYSGVNNCAWLISGQLGQVIIIYIRSLDIESCPACQCAGLRIYNGNSSNADIITSLCGYTIPSPNTPLSTSLADVFITFNTTRNTRDPYKGFTLDYEIQTLSDHACKTHDTVARMKGQPGDIVSPGWDEQDVPDDSKCQWTIQAPLSKVIVLEFCSFDIDGTTSEQGTCVDAVLDVYDGDSPRDPRIARLCGGPLYPSPLTSRASSMVITLETSGKQKSKGFHLHFRFEDQPGNGSLAVVLVPILIGSLAFISFLILCIAYNAHESYLNRRERRQQSMVAPAEWENDSCASDNRDNSGEVGLHLRNLFIGLGSTGLASGNYPPPAYDEATGDTVGNSEITVTFPSAPSYEEATRETNLTSTSGATLSDTPEPSLPTIS